MKKPNFFIVGAPKCGTTAMYEYLKAHPDIYMPDKKELHFWGSDLISNWFVKNANKYYEAFLGALNENMVGEASVWYLYSKKAANEIKEYNPNSKIIIMLRNPVDMLYSQHSQFLYNGNENINDFGEALNAEDERKQGHNVPQSAHFVEGLYYRETAKYVKQVKRYFDIFGRENVHVIIFEDFKKNTVEVYNKTLKHLEVNNDFSIDFKVINPNKKVRSTKIRYFLQNPTFPGKRYLPSAIRKILGKLIERANTKYLPRPEMDIKIRRTLQKEFAPEIDKLSDLLKRDLRHWYLK